MTPLRFAVLTSLALVSIAAVAQDDSRSVQTQILVNADSKADMIPDATAVNLQIDSKSTPLVSFLPVRPSDVQIAVLIDDGLSRSANSQMNDLTKFAATLPAGIELLVGYMSNGSVRVATPFTADHAAAAAAFRIPMGIPGESASPYFCLSEFVKHWPASDDSQRPKARIVMMLTNGVDPYNGSTSPLNQDSPYVAEALKDAQRAGVAVYSIYYRDAGFRGGSASFSGQSYLAQVADGTGAMNYFEGTGSPVSLTPFLNQFLHAIRETYVATFNAPADAGGRDHLVHVKLNTSTPKLKLRHPDEVRPGNREAAATATMAGQ
jgi:hypothetical protein